MSWFKTIGWFLTIVPVLALFSFSLWMIKELMNDDENIKIFVSVCLVAWFVGVGMLVMTYFTDFAQWFNLAG
jgi:O-antigen/teichoic acid export membrane protein